MIGESQKEVVDFLKANNVRIVPKKTTVGTLLSLETAVGEKKEQMGMVLPHGLGQAVSEKEGGIPGANRILLYVAHLYQMSGENYESSIFDHLREFIEPTRKSL